MVGKLKEKSVEGYVDPPPKFVKLGTVFEKFWVIFLLMTHFI